MRLGFRSLESRIVTLFLVLIVAVQVIGLLVIQRGIDSNARQSIAGELNNGAKVFGRLLEQNAQNLRFGARLLARDTAFLAAIGNNKKNENFAIKKVLSSVSLSSSPKLSKTWTQSTGFFKPTKSETLTFNVRVLCHDDAPQRTYYMDDLTLIPASA